MKQRTANSRCGIVTVGGRVEFTGRHKNTLRLLFDIYTV